MNIWIRSPLAVLAHEADGGIVVADGVIVELVRAGQTPLTVVDEIFDARRFVVIPGLVNAHHHMFQNLTRAHPKGMNKSLFPWLEALFPIWADKLNPDNFRLACRLALTELLMSGCTTVSDHHYFYPASLASAMDIEAEEAAALGMRMTLTRGSQNLTVADGGNAVAAATQDIDTILADCERVIGRYHDARPGSMTQVSLAPCAPFNVTKQLMAETATLARKHGCKLHTHLSETEEEIAYCREKFNCTPVDYIEELGWLESDVWLAHGVHFNDDEVKRLGRHRVGVCHCPTSNMTLGSGHCRTLELEAAGCTVGLGVDGSSSNDSSNLMEGVRHALLLNRLTYSPHQVTHIDALRWSTAGSAECLGRADIGTIEVGKQADLAFFSLDELRFSGAGDPIAALVLCGAHSAERVMIGGKWTVVDGYPVGVDLAQLREEHGRASTAFLASI